MSLTICPECNHEVSNLAETCPNCGRPISASTPIPTERVVVARPHRKEGFPTWAYAPLGILAIVIIFLMIFLFRNNEDETAGNVNIRLANQRKTPEPREVSRVENPPNQIEVPPSTTQVNPPSQTSAPMNPPTTSAPSYPTSSTAVPSTQTEVKAPLNGKGIVVIDAKISTKAGTIQSVKNEKFYLLDKDLDEILSDAKLEPIEGNNLSDSFGLAVLYPERYPDFKRDALNAINRHIKYNTTTDNGGKGAIKEVKPDSYYLFGITKTKNGFAIWSSAVSIMEGENKLNLQPAMLNEIPDRSSE
jgi:hypothetical protein